MNVIPFVHEGLGNSSYLVGLGDGRGMLVDPDRTVARYLQAADAHGLMIDAIFETHLHADFVSGAREASHATGARVYFPAGAESRVAHKAVAAGERITFGGAEVQAIASPGHTPEHVSYVLRTARGRAMLFSGGALIVGGAARTDLISPEATERLTRAQFRTLHTAFSDLPDETLLLPTHGGGSLCSAAASGERASTLGQERAHNAALAVADEAKFVRWFPSTFPAAPDYFFRMRAFNQTGPRLRSEVAPPPALPPRAFEEALPGAVVIDVRGIEAYSAAHIPGSLSIAFRPQYAVWLGWLVPPDATLRFVTEGPPPEALIDETLLVGYERFEGWLDGGIDGWRSAGLPLRSLELLSPAAARRALAAGAVALDVREPNEWREGHLPGALHVPLGSLDERLDTLPKDRPIVSYCGSSARASTAVSLLERAGVSSVINLAGGSEAWQEAGFELVRP